MYWGPSDGPVNISPKIAKNVFLHNFFIVASAARDSIIKSNHFPCYTPVIQKPHVNNSRTGWVGGEGWGAERSKFFVTKLLPDD